MFIIILLLLTPIILLLTLKTIKEKFTTPVAANVPAMKNLDGLPFLVGNKTPFIDIPIVPSKGKYMFRKPTLLYDGVWGEKCELKDGYQTCDWNEENAYYPLDKSTYGTQNFFQLPDKEFKDGICSKPDCGWNSLVNDKGETYKENYQRNKPYLYDKPTVEDILGYPPQDNNLYFFKTPSLINRTWQK